MKKYLICLFCLSMLLPVGLVSCGEETVTAYVYVAQVGEDYVIADIDGEGRVKIMCDAEGKGFEVFDTLKLTYRKSDLAVEEGTFTSLAGNTDAYDRVLTKAVSIRESIPVLGEPLYG